MLTKTVKRKLADKGLLAIPSRVRDPNDYRFGGYMVVDAETRLAVWGSHPDFHLTAQDVRDIANETR